MAKRGLGDDGSVGEKNTFYISMRTQVHILRANVNTGCVAEVSVTAVLLLGDERQRQGEPLEACRTASPAYIVGGGGNTYEKPKIFSMKQGIRWKTRTDTLTSMHAPCTVAYTYSQRHICTCTE